MFNIYHSLGHMTFTERPTAFWEVKAGVFLSAPFMFARLRHLDSIQYTILHQLFTVI